MQPNPFVGLAHSRKFWLAVMDAGVSSLAIVLTWFLAPDKVGQVLTLIGLWQPVLIVVIGSITVEDAAKIKADATVKVANLSLTETKVEVKEAAEAREDLKQALK